MQWLINYSKNFIIYKILDGDKSDKPYIHLNNYPPTNPKFSTVWSEIQELYNKDILDLINHNTAVLDTSEQTIKE